MRVKPALSWISYPILCRLWWLIFRIFCSNRSRSEISCRTDIMPLTSTSDVSVRRWKRSISNERLRRTHKVTAARFRAA